MGTIRNEFAVVGRPIFAIQIRTKFVDREESTSKAEANDPFCFEVEDEHKLIVYHSLEYSDSSFHSCRIRTI